MTTPLSVGIRRMDGRKRSLVMGLLVTLASHLPHTLPSSGVGPGVRAAHRRTKPPPGRSSVASDSGRRDGGCLHASHT